MREAKLEPNVIYNAGISACGNCNQWQRALALLSEMRETKLEPNAISYGTGISACEASGQWANALDLLESMLGARVDPAAENSQDECWYVHNFEAGGPKDVLKHIVLVALLQQMAAVADPFTFIDMHAASGVYHLLSEEEPFRCRFFEDGVLRLSHPDSFGEGVVADYLASVWRCNQALGASPDDLCLYPGSPALAWQWLRPQDSALLFEAAAEPYEALRRSFALLDPGAGLYHAAARRLLPAVHSGALAGFQRAAAGAHGPAVRLQVVPRHVERLRPQALAPDVALQLRGPVVPAAGARDGRQPAQQGPERRRGPRARGGDVVRELGTARRWSAGIGRAGHQPALQRPRAAPCRAARGRRGPGGLRLPGAVAVRSRRRRRRCPDTWDVLCGQALISWLG
ncbi:unnamed protein product [Prorocentrum cordatum]|uniref:Pentatricopeptide repeat-containing protein n=1 Tax=Prorocentrum cordatum TaxID=2364126 RepID=A0ABN9SES0_9DINO|nr:unnamed protein product [Polarella glacialis]